MRAFCALSVVEPPGFISADEDQRSIRRPRRTRHSPMPTSASSA